jgi:hypothetical protein
VTALGDLLTRETRERLLERVRELDELAVLMRQPGGLAEPPEPPPLCRASRDTNTERTAS